MARPVTLTHDAVATAADAIACGSTLKSVAAGLNVTPHGLRKAALRCGIDLQSSGEKYPKVNSVDSAEAALEALYRDVQYVAPTAATLVRQALGIVRGVGPAISNDLRAQL